MAARDLVEYVAKSLVDDPSAVTVDVIDEDGTTVIELHVAEDDMGKVIGRNGSVAKALRTLLKVTAARDGEPVQLEILCASSLAACARRNQLAAQARAALGGVEHVSERIPECVSERAEMPTTRWAA